MNMMTFGIVALCAGVILLIAAIAMMRRMMKQGNAQGIPPEHIAAIAAATAVAFDSRAAAQCDPQLIAVITAALMASESAQGGARLVVRSVRKAHSASAWASAGRQEQINC